MVTPEVHIFKNQCLKIGENLYLNAKTADVNFKFGSSCNKIKHVPAHIEFCALHTQYEAVLSRDFIAITKTIAFAEI